MSTSQNLMEMKEELIRAHCANAFGMLDGFDHVPRIARLREVTAPVERSSGIGTRRRFRTTTPGMVTKATARPEGLLLIGRIEGADGDDPLTSPAQAAIQQGLRRALAVAHVVSDQYAEQTGLAELMRDNLAGRLAADKRAEFSELLATSSLISLFTFASMTGYLLAAQVAETKGLSRLARLRKF